jgi:hypothetical protein
MAVNTKGRGGTGFLALLAVTAVVIFVPNASSSAVHSSGGPRTEVIHVRPVDDSGRRLPTWTVTGTYEHGVCHALSSVIEAAYTCTAEPHWLFDPCWPEVDGSFGASALCVAKPWTNEAHRVIVDRPLERMTDEAEGSVPPWGVELGDGTKCGAVRGAHDVVRDDPTDPDEWTEADVVDYECDGSDVGLLRGIDTTHGLWRARAATLVTGDWERLPGWVSIAKAWFGVPVEPSANRPHIDI